MSRFVMKQDWFSFGDDYTIRDANGDDVFRVDGKVFCIGDQLSLQTMDGRELAYIDQKLLSWGPTYEIWRGGGLAAVVKKSVFTLFHCKFTVDVPGPDDLLAEGDFWEHEYRFTREGREVASVSKRYFSWTDTYGIEVPQGEDPVLILASAVVIDLCCHQDQR
ncbi:MAG TPA: LURP-one-related family protein [Planctomycetota bacterium]|nr:LURP-one-related family protein [Planctomycetota bacterium]